MYYRKIDYYFSRDRWAEGVGVVLDAYEALPDNEEELSKYEMNLVSQYGYYDDGRPTEIVQELSRQRKVRSRSKFDDKVLPTDEETEETQIEVETHLAGKTPINEEDYERYRDIDMEEYGWHQCTRSGCKNIFSTDPREEKLTSATLPDKIRKRIETTTEILDTEGSLNKYGMKIRIASSRQNKYCSTVCKDIADLMNKKEKRK